ncbi:MAG: 6-phosphogluconolactonase [Candidatus Omnitrophota bacterium]|jgi:6-phosphogluconolactonase
MTLNRQIYVFENSYALTNFYIKKWAEVAVQAICDRGVFTTALSGGRTPVELLCKLSSIDNFELWANTKIFQVDERFVKQDDKDNNFKLIYENLLHYVAVPPDNVFSIATDVDTATMAASNYEHVLRKTFNVGFEECPQFDLINLGLGEDGHTASLFPGTSVLTEEKQLVVPVSEPNVSHNRISLTFPVINNARNIIFHVQGRAKAKILRKVIDGDISYPATQVSPNKGELIFLLDKEAASVLEYGDEYEVLDEGILLK